MSRIGRHGFVYGAGMLLSKVVSFVMLPLYTHYLTPADYGLLQLIQMVLEVASIVAGSRLGAGIFRFYHKAETAAARRAVLSTALLVLVTSYAAATAALYVFAPAVAQAALGSTAYVTLVRVAGMGLAFEGLLLVPFAYLRLRDQSLLYVGVGAARLLLQLGLNVAFVVYLHLGATGVVLSTFVANVAAGVALTVYLVRDVGLRFSPSAARDLLRFGIPFVGTQVATFILAFGDRFFLMRVSDATAVGLYGLAYQFGFLLATIGETPFTMVWEPVRFEIAKRSDRDELHARGFIYFNVVLLTIGVLITLFVGDFLRIVATPAFFPARDLVPIIVLAYVLQSWTMMHNVGMQVRERTEFYTLSNWLGAMAALVGYAVLIPRLLGLGAALATLLSFGVREVAVYALSQRLWPVRYRWGPVLRLLVLAIGVCGVGVFLPQFGLGLSIVTHAVLLVAYVVGLWHAGVLSRDDRWVIRQFLRSRGLALRVAIEERP
ncbi:MAG TPA: oligosaccharide flippase family protein [Gemmatimonadales bacterium]|nr:oligosaccharide flippase family protein [Gemmatimonadales bacterium]